MPQTHPKNSTTVRSSKTLPAWLKLVPKLDRISPTLTSRVVYGLFFRPRKFRRPDWEKQIKDMGKPIDVAASHTKFASKRIVRAWSWGNGEAGRVLLVHGWEGRGTQLGALIEPLVKQGYEVVAFDAPGHGDTGGLTSSLFAFRDAISAIVDQLGLFDVVITHSMGGAAALMAAKDRRLASRFVLIAPPTDVRDFTAQVTAALKISEQTRSIVHRQMEQNFKVTLESLQTPSLAALRTEAALVVHDSNDVEVPLERGQAVAAAWEDSTMIVTNGLGHRRILKDRGAIESIVNFVLEQGDRERAVSNAHRLLV